VSDAGAKASEEIRWNTVFKIAAETGEISVGTGAA
jgi:hypothetical protein